jgi:uncharacterized protein (TIGR02118 family)
MPLVVLFLAGIGRDLAPLPAARTLMHVPSEVRDPFLDDGRAPQSVAQIYFGTLAALEAAAAQIDGGAHAEAMTVHRFAVREPWVRTPERYCTYLVAYEGPAEDESAWLAYYLEHHPPLMAKLPGVRELEIYTPLDWHSPPAWRCVRHLQRNKVAFDSAAALALALDSPVRREMRADFGRFPAYRGRVTHYAMTTELLQ